MSALVDRVAQVTTRIVTREATVVAIEPIGSRFRRVDIRVPGHPTWSPGQKLQIRVRGFDFRTYTPCGWTGDQVSLVAFHPANEGPAGPWLEALAVGDTIEVFGPRGALRLDGDTPVLLVGDETSFALAAAVRGDHRTIAAQRYEVTDVEDARVALAALGLADATVVLRAPDGGHLAELGALVASDVQDHPDAMLVLTGRAKTVADVRRRLKDAGLHPDTRAKAHWDERRKGLD